ncbi:26S proteasome non-ATPase regulatory subunit 3 [Glugoides intestinalis]
MRSLVEIITEMETERQESEEYKKNYDLLIKRESPEDMENLLNEKPERFFYVAPLLAGSWLLKHRFEDIYNLLEKVDLSGEDRKMDFFNGKLIKCYYQSLKHLGKPVDTLYKILCTNREYGNDYSVAVTTNAILDCQLNAHIYEQLDANITDPEERCKYCFYHGVIFLIRGEYKKALKFFDECDVLNSTKMDLLLKKYIITCKLLLGDYNLFYPYEEGLIPYFSLIGCVKRGDVELFYTLLDEHRQEYFGMNLYFVIRRLLQNVVQEGLRRIALCYSRIKVSDISEILGVNVGHLIHNVVKDMGIVEAGVFYSTNTNLLNTHCGEQVCRAVEARKSIEKLMKYPEIVPLSYEKITKN